MRMRNVECHTVFWLVVVIIAPFIGQFWLSVQSVARPDETSCKWQLYQGEQGRHKFFISSYSLVQASKWLELNKTFEDNTSIQCRNTETFLGKYSVLWRIQADSTYLERSRTRACTKVIKALHSLGRCLSPRLLFIWRVCMFYFYISEYSTLCYGKIHVTVKIFVHENMFWKFL